MNITENGVFELPTNKSASTSCFLISGAFGGGTIKIGYLDSADQFIMFEGGDATDVAQKTIMHGTPIKIYAELTGATSPAIEIRTTSVFGG